MAKVLACPSCGYKHPLDQLAGLETFACEQCGKKLAVPLEATVLVPSRGVVPQSVPDIVSSSNSQTKLDLSIDVNESDDVIVVARSSLSTSPTIAQFDPTAQEKLKQKISNKNDNLPDSPVLPTQSTSSPERKLPHFHLPFISHVLVWLISIPAGFVLVVLVPRFLGFGFHASDFVDVITTQSLGRYEIVITLIVLWSFATVICVSFSNGLIRKILKR